MSAAPANSSPHAYLGPMTEAQLAALRGLQSLIDSCIDGGLTFRTTLRRLERQARHLDHDADEATRRALDLDSALEALAVDPEPERPAEEAARHGPGH